MERPLLGPLLFENEQSDARDHCANERTFLSWLRLSIYMAIVSVAIVVSFHLQHQPTAIEKRLALPFGIIFWILSLACLASGLANYLRTVTRYSRRAALVQSGWKTELVSVYVVKLAKILTRHVRSSLLSQQRSWRRACSSYPPMPELEIRYRNEVWCLI